MIIFDNSTLSALCSANALDLIFCIFSEHALVIPNAVFIEFSKNHFKEKLTDFTIASPPSLPSILTNHPNYSRFGNGEIDGLALCILNDAVFVTDDSLVRQAGKSLGLKIIGTVTILLEAYDRNCFDNDLSYKNCINTIIEDLYLSSELIALLRSKIL